MIYKLKSWAYNGSPKDNGDETFTQPIIITVGVLGDLYGFVSPDPQKDMTSIVIPNIGKDGKQMDALCQVAAEALVTKNYPNT